MEPNRPPTQGPEHVAAVRPVAPPKSPAGQLVHTPAAPVLYCPTGQTEAVDDVDPLGHAYPALQGPEHVDVVRAVEDPNCPGGHDEHDGAPPVLYCPIGHAVAVDVVDPARQKYLQGIGGAKRMAMTLLLPRVNSSTNEDQA